MPSLLMEMILHDILRASPIYPKVCGLAGFIFDGFKNLSMRSNFGILGSREPFETHPNSRRLDLALTGLAHLDTPWSF